LVGHLQAADQLIPLGGGQAGQGRVRPAGALGLAGRRPGRGRGRGRQGAQGVGPVAVLVVAGEGGKGPPCRGGPAAGRGGAGGGVRGARVVRGGGGGGGWGRR